MADKRRGHGDDSIYFDHRVGTECLDARQHRSCAGRWRGVVSLGHSGDGRRIRRKVSGQSKAEVRDKLQALHDELRDGIRTSATYTVRDAVDDWLANGLTGVSAKTVATNREVLAPLVALIGATRLRDLTSAHVRAALVKLAQSRSTRAVQMARAALVRAIRYAEANDLVGRNVAALVTAPRGQEGRPSRSLTLRQAHALIEAAERSRLYGYIVLCLLMGCRTEEARALRWDDVDLAGDPSADPPVPPNMAVWRSVRSHGDVKTRKSRRTLRLPVAVVEALKVQKVRQAEDRLVAGSLWQDRGLVFASAVGTPMDASHVRRSFRKICAAAGIGENWTPRELRHTFVSIMSEQGVPVEEIARLVGHSVTTTTEAVYRHELRPVISTGAEVMDTIFKVG
ncbi:MAG TPA: site-specific integrase [Streptosporangiaceae bacterium]|nr:site-specific integrase [Streptosporangiaceae bacterium]